METSVYITETFVQPSPTPDGYVTYGAPTASDWLSAHAEEGYRFVSGMSAWSESEQAVFVTYVMEHRSVTEMVIEGQPA